MLEKDILKRSDFDDDVQNYLAVAKGKALIMIVSPFENEVIYRVIKVGLSTQFYDNFEEAIEAYNSK